jgi:hypothetical protein
VILIPELLGGTGGSGGAPAAASGGVPSVACRCLAQACVDICICILFVCAWSFGRDVSFVCCMSAVSGPVAWEHRKITGLVVKGCACLSMYACVQAPQSDATLIMPPHSVCSRTPTGTRHECHDPGASLGPRSNILSDTGTDSCQHHSCSSAPLASAASTAPEASCAQVLPAPAMHTMPRFACDEACITIKTSDDADSKPLQAPALLLRYHSSVCYGLPQDCSQWDLSNLLIEGRPMERAAVVAWLNCVYQHDRGRPFQEQQPAYGSTSAAELYRWGGFKPDHDHS